MLGDCTNMEDRVVVSIAERLVAYFFLRDGGEEARLGRGGLQAADDAVAERLRFCGIRIIGRQVPAQT